MVKPSLSELALNFYRNGCSQEIALDEAERFLAYHTSKGWKIGKVAMVSWAGAAATWRRNMKARAGDISRPRVAVKPAKSDSRMFRITIKGKLVEFDDQNTPSDPAIRLAWENWRDNPARKNGL